MPRSRPAAIAAVAVSLLIGAGGPMADAADCAAARAETLIGVNELLSGYRIEARLVEGRLRLEGAVSNALEHRLAGELAALTVPGVEIDNALAMSAAMSDEPGEQYVKDRDLTAATRLRQRLAWQVSNTGLDVEVAVDDGVARLRGQVGTTATKDRLSAVAKSTKGIEQVFSYITVDPSRVGTERERQREAAEMEREDSWIATRLRALLAADSAVTSGEIEVRVRGGVVLLRGSVASAAERRIVETIAGDVPGVQEVDSRLIIDAPAHAQGNGPQGARGSEPTAMVRAVARASRADNAATRPRRNA